MSLQTLGNGASISRHAPRSDPEFVGVSIVDRTNRLYLRFHFRDAHLNKIKFPERLTIRGNPANGFIITGDKKGLKWARPNKSGDVVHLIQTITKFEISKRERKVVYVRPIFEKDHIRLPAMPQAWIDVKPEFDTEQNVEAAPYEEGPREVKLPKNDRDDGIVIKSETVPVLAPTNGHSAPAKTGNIGDSYKLPDNIDIRMAQDMLAAKLMEVRKLIEYASEKTGMKLGLNARLQLVVLL